MQAGASSVFSGHHPPVGAGELELEPCGRWAASGYVAEPKGLQLRFCAGFPFSLECGPWLEWSQAGGAGATSLRRPHPFPSVYRACLCPGANVRLCAGTRELAVLASVLVRGRTGVWAGFVPNKCAHSCWQRQSPP